MTIGTVLEKLGKGEPLDPLEIKELRLFGDQTQTNNSLVSNWLAPGTKKMDARKMDLPFQVFHSAVLVSNAASFVVTIPTSHSHLFILSYGRIDGSGTYNSRLNAYVNGDTGNNYSYQDVTANDTTPAGQQVLANTQFGIGYLAGGGTSAGRACSGFCVIPHYKSGSFKHSISVSSATNAADDTIVVSDSIWNNTNAIETLTIYAATGDNIAAGSLISVYGIL